MRAVVTGIGVVSPFGWGVPELVAGLREGASAVSAVRYFDPQHLPGRIAAQVPGVPAHGSPSARRRLFAGAAATEALVHAGTGAAAPRGALVLGVGIEVADTDRPDEDSAEMIALRLAPSRPGSPLPRWREQALDAGP